MSCSTFEILIGPKDATSCARVCQIIFWIFSSLITLITRIIFLFFCLYGTNSIVVTVYPSSDIFLNNNCSFITEVSGQTYYNFYKLYNKSQQAELYFGENNRLMSDDYDYNKKYYYCGDVTKFFNTSWIPVLTWFTIIILPQFLLSTIAFIITFKLKSFKILLLNPGFTLISIISHHNIGPLTWSQNSPRLIHSKVLSYINILLTFLGMCFIIHLITAPFGAGDGRQLRFVLPLVICVPMFIFSGAFAIVFMHCTCCNIRRRVFNPEDPSKVYILGIGDTLDQQEEKNLQMKK